MGDDSAISISINCGAIESVRAKSGKHSPSACANMDPISNFISPRHSNACNRMLSFLCPYFARKIMSPNGLFLQLLDRTEDHLGDYRIVFVHVPRSAHFGKPSPISRTTADTHSTNMQLQCIQPADAVLEIVLFAGFLIHIYWGVQVWLFNRRARKKGYIVYRPSENSSLPSRIMILSGSIVLVFPDRSSPELLGPDAV